MKFKVTQGVYNTHFCFVLQCGLAFNPHYHIKQAPVEAMRQMDRIGCCQDVSGKSSYHKKLQVKHAVHKIIHFCLQRGLAFNPHHHIKQAAVEATRTDGLDKLLPRSMYYSKIMPLII
jgi:hypothetical protein